MSHRKIQSAADSDAEMGPLLTLKAHKTLLSAVRAGMPAVECSLDLGRSTAMVAVGDEGWVYQGQSFPYLDACKDRTIYYWADGEFQPALRYTTSLFKLVPTQWGSPTFEIDGIKMLPTARTSPYEDAGRKVALIQPHGKVILDTCGGLGYFAAWCVRGKAKRVLSYEKQSDVAWLRGLNPWSPKADDTLRLILGDICREIESQDSGLGGCCFTRPTALRYRRRALFPGLL